MPAGSGRAAYAAEVKRCEAAGLMCVHEIPAGDLVRPWCATPACALCRRRHPVHWRTLGEPPTRRPDNVIPIQGTRRLW